jgi:hypothetical protein
MAIASDWNAGPIQAQRCGMICTGHFVVGSRAVKNFLMEFAKNMEDNYLSGKIGTEKEPQPTKVPWP